MSTTPETKAPSKSMIILAAVVANIIWGTPFKLLKLMYASMDVSREALGDRYIAQVLTIVSVRFLLAGLLTLAVAMIMRQNIVKMSKIQFRNVVIMGLVSTGFAYFFFNIGNVNISSTINSTILAQSTIFFTALLANFIYSDDKLTPMKTLGLVIGFAGLIISQLTGGTSIGDMFHFSITGEGFMLMYGLMAALGTILAKYLGSSLNVFVMTGWSLVVGAIFLFVVGTLMGGSLTSVHWTTEGILLLILLAAFAAIPFTLWNWAATWGKLSEISVFKFIMPISGSLLSVAFGESFTTSLLIGLILVCVSIIMLNLPSKKSLQAN
ncbi:DMT family transporter [Weissella viridescens]|uniref:DMT family transporter n=1 Tax=Weissella viridescens TaxID=1629 RepID=UPI0022E3AA48|nr:DMT family transporter [Weissella viridescens]